MYGEIAAGGMATVHYGRLSGQAGFSRTVAIKRLHPQYAKDPEFVTMFLDEALLAARIRHPNVVSTLDVVATSEEIFLVMEYVQGESLARLMKAVRAGMTAADTRIVATIVSGVLHGLHAAHEARDEQGVPLNIVHRDVSPQNILAGVDGVARVLDFGVAKAAGRVQTTREGQLKGKIAYMAPEQLHGAPVTRQTDVYASAVVAWEGLTGKRLFQFDNEAALVTAILQGRIPPPSEAAPHVPAAFDRVVMRGLERDASKRYATAREMAVDLEKCVGIASASEVGEWVERLAGDELLLRMSRIADIESSSMQRNSLFVRQLAETLEAPIVQQPGEPARPVREDAMLTTFRRDPVVPPRSMAPTVPEPAEMRSDLSSIAVSPMSRRPMRSRNRTAVVAGVVAAGAVLLLAMVLVSMGNGGARSSTTAASSALPPPSAESPPVVSAEPAASPSGASSASMATIAVSALPVAAPTTDPAQLVRRRVVPLVPGPAPTPKPAATPPPDCDPPFTIDDKGHKHYKPACLQ